MHSYRFLRSTAIEDDPLFDELTLDQGSCRLLGPTALVVQSLMGVLAILSLIYKRQREKPKRPWRIWLFDVSKQVIGQMFVHGVNILISNLGSHRISGNACVYYFLNILIDTTLGVALIYLSLHFFTVILTEKLEWNGFESGQYGSPPSVTFWARQAVVYVLSITTMKLIVVALFALWPGVIEIGTWLLSWLGSTDAVQVIFTMGIFPILMNIVQFWLIDSIVKAQATQVNLPADASRTSLNDEAREPLFQAGSDDEDDDSQGYDIENPRPRSPRNRSRSKSKSLTRKPSVGTTEEYKSSGGGSGSITPGAVDVDEDVDGSEFLKMHAYPPSLGGSSSAASPSSRAMSISPPSTSRSTPSHTRSKSRRRSPPPPLLPRSPLQPAINSPIPPSTAGSNRHPSPIPKGLNKNKENGRAKGDAWDHWDDHDDWADRVGEEEWTGKRMEAKKGSVNEVWGAESPMATMA